MLVCTNRRRWLYIEDVIRFPEVDEPANDEVEEEKQEQQETREERIRLREFSNTELLDVTSMMHIIVRM